MSRNFLTSVEVEGQLTVGGEAHFGDLATVARDLDVGGDMSCAALESGPHSVTGANANGITGPNTYWYTTADPYPLFGFLNYTHDNINMLFDVYFDGSWRSSDAGSGFKLTKNLDTFLLDATSGYAPGTVPVFTNVWNYAVSTGIFTVNKPTNINGATRLSSTLIVGGSSSETPVVAGALQIYGGSTSYTINRASTHNVELLTGADSFGGIVGTVTDHDLLLRTNNITRVTIDASTGVATFASHVNVTGDLDLEGGSVKLDSVRPAIPTYAIGAAIPIAVVDTSTGNKTITLPNVSAMARRTVIVKKVDATANTVTVRHSANIDTIDGAASKVLTAQWQVLRIYSDGTEWLTI